MKLTNPEILRLIVFAGALAAGVTIVIVFHDIFLPLLLGLGIAYVLDPAVSWLDRRRRSRGLAVLVIFLLFLLALVAVVVFLVPAIVDQFQALLARIPLYAEKIRETLAPLIDRLHTLYPTETREVEQRLVQALRENIPGIATMATRWVAGAFTGILDVLLFLLSLIFVPIFAFYLMVDFPRMKSSLRELIPLPYRSIVLARIGEVDEAVSSFLRGQVVIALILAAVNTAGLLIIGVPLALLIGVVSGLANMIPYMSTVFGLLPALLVSWAEDQSLARLIAIVALFTGGQTLESSLLTPRIIGRKVNLHPVWVLLAVIGFGSLFGFMGMVVAIPAAAAIKVFASHWIATYKASSLYHAGAQDDGIAGSQPPSAPVR